MRTKADKGEGGCKIRWFMRTSIVHHPFLRCSCFCLYAYRHSYLLVLCLHHFYRILIEKNLAVIKIVFLGYVIYDRYEIAKIKC
jgi:hypothetical protein